MLVILLQVALKALKVPSQAGMAAFEEQVQTLWHISADSHHICRVYGVSCFNMQACLVIRLYDKSLANKMIPTSGQPHCFYQQQQSALCNVA